MSSRLGPSCACLFICHMEEQIFDHYTRQTPDLQSMLRPFAHPVPCCWMLLRVVAQSLKPVKLFSQQLPKFFGSVITEAQRNNVGSVSTALPTLLWPRTFITHGLQRLMGFILPTMHRRSQHCWELLHPFAHHCQRASNNSQHCQCNNIGSFCVRLHAALNYTKIDKKRTVAMITSILTYTLGKGGLQRTSLV